MKIVFFDTSNTGHHWFYNSNLMLSLSEKFKIVYITKKITSDQFMILNKKNIEIEVLQSNQNHSMPVKLTKQLELYKDFANAKKIAKGKNADVFVNLYFDPYISINFLISEKCREVNVLHWIPNNKFKIKLLSKMKNRNDTDFLVHTNEIKEKLEDINKELKVTKIDYPVKEFKINNHNKKSLLDDLKLPGNLLNDKIMLYFGGTRHDKGLDILLNSLNFVCSDVTLLIVGKEETFSREFIREKVKENSNEIRVYTVLSFVPEEDIQKYFYISDVIVLPYRKYFNGESGILTDAIQMGKPVAVPDIIHFPEIIRNFKNGKVFEAENPVSLAKSIDILFEKNEYFTLNANQASSSFVENRNIENFSKKFSESFLVNQEKK